MRDELEFEFGSSGGPPVGTYTARLDTVQATEHSEYGPGVRFRWHIDSGTCSGMVASRTTNRTPSSANIAGRIMAGLLGRQIKPGERVSLTECIGRRYLIVVGLAPSGTSTRVESCMPL